jgi:hypothetical protein
MYFLYKKYHITYILLGLSMTIILFVLYELSDCSLPTLPTTWLMPPLPTTWLMPTLPTTWLMRPTYEYQLWPSDRGWI